MAPSLILLSLGTHEAPFARAINLVTPLARKGHALVIQHGHTPASDDLPNVTWQQYMSYQDVVETMRAADTVICHAGVGTIMTALKLGHLPIVIPRLQNHGEHVDDHQWDIATRLDERGLATCLIPGQPVPLVRTLRIASREKEFARGGQALRTAVAHVVNEPRETRRPRLVRALLGP